MPAQDLMAAEPKAKPIAACPCACPYGNRLGKGRACIVFRDVPISRN